MADENYVPADEWDRWEHDRAEYLRRRDMNDWQGRKQRRALDELARSLRPLQAQIDLLREVWRLRRRLMEALSA